MTNQRLTALIAFVLTLALTSAPLFTHAQESSDSQGSAQVSASSSTPSPEAQIVGATPTPEADGALITPMSDEEQAALAARWPGFEPNGAQWTLWTPSSPVTFTVGHPPLITVRISTDEGGFITTTARFVLAIEGVIQPEQPALVTSVVGTSTLDLTANIGAAPSGSLIRFRIDRASDNTTVESPVYGIQRRYRTFLPIARLQPPPPQFTAAPNPCAAQNTPTSQLISQTVFYTPATTLTNSWFYAVNPNPNGIVQVRLRGYNAGGQLQVWYENPDCNNTLMMQPFSFGADPVVTVSGVPQGRVYFRVASSSAPPPFGIAWQAFPANNNPCTPWPLPANTTLRWTARNAYDFFSLNFPSSDIIRISGSYPQAGTQFQLRSPISSGCDPINSTTRILPNFGSVSAPNALVTFTIGVPQGGTYFIRTSTGGAVFPGNADYQLRWEPVRINRGLFSTNPDQPQGCYAPGAGTPVCQGDLPGSLNRPPGSTIYFYWFAADREPNGTPRTLGSLRIQAVGVNRCGTGNPATVQPLGTGNEVPLPTSPYGVIALTFPTQGGYDIFLRARDPNGNVYFFDGKPVAICP